MSKKKFNMPTNQRPTWAEIDLNNLAANFRNVKQRVGPETKVMGVVKANAYGHGAVRCAQRLAAEGADWFGIATPEEGVELRDAGITQPILCLSGFWGDQSALCLKHRLTPVVYRVDMLRKLNEAAREAGVVADVHWKIDTGMGRLGVRFDQVDEFIAAFSELRNVRVDGIMTHFAAADDAACRPLTHDQIHRFHEVVSVFRQHGHTPAHLHLANSAATFGEK